MLSLRAPHLRALAAALAAILAPAAARAQGQLIAPLPAGASGDNRGAAVAGGGDLDGDGRGDWIVGAPLDDAGGADAGAVRAYSGATGALLWERFGSIAGAELGGNVAIVGDTDGDLRADVAAGAAAANRVALLSGANGSVVRTLIGDAPGERYGAAVSAIGDVDGDGRADLVVGAPECDVAGTDAGLARVVSGASGATLRDVHGASAGTQYGSALARAGDVDGDSVPDFLAAGTGGSNAVEVRSGATGALVRVVFGPASLDWFGHALAGVGDVSGDGVPDFVVGAPQSFLGPGYVRAHSGANGAVLWTANGSGPAELFGWSLSAAGDVDGDGRGDALAGAPLADVERTPGALRENAGVVRILSGASGAVLGTFAGPAADALAGWSVGGGACGHGIAGGPSSGGGAAWGFDTLQTPGWVNYCAGAPNSVGPGARMEASGTTSVAADDLVVRAVGLPLSTFGVFLQGRVAVQTPFGDGWRCVGNPVIRRAIVQASGGVATLAFANSTLAAHNRAVPGDVVRVQFWYRNVTPTGAGFNLTDGLRVLFCP